MSNPHTDVARPIPLPHAVKVVLMILASRACSYCGLCWPGSKNLMLECGLGETRLRSSLDDLVSAGLLRVHAYPNGGRGRATEYVVLPGHLELSPAPCAKCAGNQRKGSRREGFDTDGTDKPLATRGVSAKPLAGDPQNPAHGYGPTVSTTQPERARARGEERPPSGDATSGPLYPSTPEEARAEVGRILQRLTPKNPDTRS